MSERDRIAMAVIGGRAQGKSTFIRKELIDKCYDMRKDKVLILTPTVPPAYKDVDECSLEDLQQRRWHGKLRYYNHQSAKQMLKDIHDLCTAGKLSKGLVVFEDCTNYIDPWPAESIRNFLVNMRMFDLDLIFTTHAVSFLPKFCRKMINTITVFRTAETYEALSEFKVLGYPNYRQIYSAWRAVNLLPKKDKNATPQQIIEFEQAYSIWRAEWNEPKEANPFIAPRLTIDTGI